MIPLKLSRQKIILYLALFAGGGLYFMANFQRVGVPGTVFDQLHVVWGLETAEITALSAIFMYVYAAGQLFAGMGVDRYGGWRVMAVGGALFALGSVLLPLTSSVNGRYCCRFITGLGASGIYLALVQEVLHAFPGRDALGVGIIMIVGYSGGITATAPLAYGVQVLGLETCLLLAGAISGLLYGLMLSCQTFLPHPHIQKVPFNLATLGQVWGRKQNFWAILFTGLNFGLYYVLQTVIGKKFLEDFAQLNAIHAAWSLSFMGIFSALGGFGLALLAQICPHYRARLCQISGLVGVVTLGGLTGLVVVDCRSKLILLLMILLASIASVNGIIIPFLKQINPSRITGTAIASANFFAYIAVAFFGNLTGSLLEIFPVQITEKSLVYAPQSYSLVLGTLTFFALLSAYASWQIKIPSE